MLLTFQKCIKMKLIFSYHNFKQIYHIYLGTQRELCYKNIFKHHCNIVRSDIEIMGLDAILVINCCFKITPRTLWFKATNSSYLTVSGQLPGNGLVKSSGSRFPTV